ncbi:MAG TPA: GIY-YIG nuclease family protein [Nostocaceae cyanobacterium]|nr:GIY-YIG nuclease family protein [Nostocaceae cyanobacterium]
MTTDLNLPTLAGLEYFAYIDENGEVQSQWQGKIGVYGIFDQDKVLQFVGYSRDVYLSLKQHLVRQPDKCYWVKVQTIDKPSRTVLENIENAWIAENGITPVGNGEEKVKWTQAIDTKLMMTAEERDNYEKSDDLGKGKVFKNVARRVEGEILAVLTGRGLKTEIRFNPKLKEEGLLDLK